MIEQLLSKKKKQRASETTEAATPSRYAVPPESTTTRRSTGLGADTAYQISAPSPTDRAVRIGPGVIFEGAIQDCDELVIEGDVKATITATRLLVLEGGCFSGAATVAEAMVQGRFDGTLTASSKLTVEATGHVAGDIRYAELEISSGGVLTGDIDVFTPGEENVKPDGGIGRKSPVQGPNATTEPGAAPGPNAELAPRSEKK